MDCCQAAALDGEVAVATVDGEKEGGVGGLPVQMPADRLACLRDTRAAGASDSSLHHPLQLSLSPPVAICEAHTYPHTHI